MSDTSNDAPIHQIRELRRPISARCADDPEKLVVYYLKLQEQFRDRLVTPVPEEGRQNSQPLAIALARQVCLELHFPREWRNWQTRQT